jgi:hypothetical protein
MHTRTAHAHTRTNLPKLIGVDLEFAQLQQVA